MQENYTNVKDQSHGPEKVSVASVDRVAPGPFSRTRVDGKPRPAACPCLGPSSPPLSPPKHANVCKPRPKRPWKPPRFPAGAAAAAPASRAGWEAGGSRGQSRGCPPRCAPEGVPACAGTHSACETLSASPSGLPKKGLQTPLVWSFSFVSAFPGTSPPRAGVKSAPRACPQRHADTRGLRARQPPPLASLRGGSRGNAPPSPTRVTPPHTHTHTRRGARKGWAPPRKPRCLPARCSRAVRDSRRGSC